MGNDHPAQRYGGKLRLLTDKLDHLRDPVSLWVTPLALPNPIQETSPTATCRAHGKTSTATATTHVNSLLIAQNGGCKSCVSGTDPALNALNTFDFSQGGSGSNFDTFFQDLTVMGENSGFPYL